MPLTAGLKLIAAWQQANFEFSCPFVRLQFGAVRKAARLTKNTKEHEGAQRKPIWKSTFWAFEPEKYWSNTKKRKHRKTFPIQDP